MIASKYYEILRTRRRKIANEKEKGYYTRVTSHVYFQTPGLIFYPFRRSIKIKSEDGPDDDKTRDRGCIEVTLDPRVLKVHGVQTDAS